MLFRTTRISPSDPPGPKQVYKLATSPINGKNIYASFKWFSRQDAKFLKNPAFFFAPLRLCARLFFQVVYGHGNTVFHQSFPKCIITIREAIPPTYQ